MTEKENLTKKCFEFDWSYGKYQNFIKDEEDLEKTKEVLWQHYKIMKNCYKYHSTFTPFERMYAIGTFFLNNT